MSLVLSGVVLGLGATVFMDLWQQLFGRLPGQSLPNWRPVGRWFWHLKDGVVFHDAIGAATPSPDDHAIGWASHYAVGILYGVIFALLAGPAWLATPTFWPAWIFAIVTVTAGWFLLQPGMGLGWAASRTPSPVRTRAISLLNHTVFGIGLWLTGLIVR
jgi:hypothetical protein